MEGECQLGDKCWLVLGPRRVGVQLLACLEGLFLGDCLEGLAMMLQWINEMIFLQILNAYI